MLVFAASSSHCQARNRHRCKLTKDLTDLVVNRMSLPRHSNSTAKQILEEHSYIQDPTDTYITARYATSNAPPASAGSSLIKSIHHLDHSPPSSLPLDSHLVYDNAGSTWRQCHCIQLDTRSSRNIEDQIRIAVPAAIQHKCREQRVALTLVIEPSYRASPANLDVLLRIKSVFVGVENVIKDEAALGFYPFRIRMSIEPELGESSAVAIPLYVSGGGGGGGSTRTRSTDTKIGAQIGFRPVTISGERSWGMKVEETREMEMVTADQGSGGNTAVLEWRLLRWSHNGMSYNSSKPHSGLVFSTRSLKAPLPGGNTGVKVESFPDVLWHLHPSMGSRFPIRFKLLLEVEMHLLWFVGKSRLFRVAEWTMEGFQFCHPFEVSDGINSMVL